MWLNADVYSHQLQEVAIYRYRKNTEIKREM